MLPEEHVGAGATRRDFLKRAGAAAWVVPTLQMLNMASAAAGTTAGSIVTTTPPPSTTEEPGCQAFAYYRIKAEWTGNGWDWNAGSDASAHCIGDGLDFDGDNLGADISISGDVREATITHSLPDCEITAAYHKAGQTCVSGTIAGDGSYAKFSAGDGQDISFVEILVKCCAEEG